MFSTDWIIASILPSTLCDWSIMKATSLRRSAARDLSHDPEELERIDGAGDQVVVGVLAIVEVKAAEQFLGEKQCDDLLDVRALGVVTRVDEHLRLLSEPPADERSGSPVGKVGAVEGRLEELVLDE